MNDFESDQWKGEVEALIQELVKHGRLSSELEKELEALLEKGHHTEAGIIAAKNSSRTGALAD